MNEDTSGNGAVEDVHGEGRAGEFDEAGATLRYSDGAASLEPGGVLVDMMI